MVRIRVYATREAVAKRTQEVQLKGTKEGILHLRWSGLGSKSVVQSKLEAVVAESSYSCLRDIGGRIILIPLLSRSFSHVITGTKCPSGQVRNSHL